MVIEIAVHLLLPPLLTIVRFMRALLINDDVAVALVLIPNTWLARLFFTTTATMEDRITGCMSVAAVVLSFTCIVVVGDS